MTSRKRKDAQRSKEKWVWIVLGVGILGAIVLMTVTA